MPGDWKILTNSLITFCMKIVLSECILLFFSVKPEIMMRTSYIIEGGTTIIYCTLKSNEINPRHVNYTWFSCNSPDSCDADSLTVESNSFSLQLNNLSKCKMEYLCKATNAAGSDNESITVLKKYGKGTRFNSRGA